jgi:hypothetical protein
MSGLSPNKFLSPPETDTTQSIIRSMNAISYDRSNYETPSSEPKVTTRPVNRGPEKSLPLSEFRPNNNNLKSPIRHAGETMMVNDVCDITVLNKRDKNDIGSDTKTAIKAVTAHMETLPVGTFKYKIFKYPSDIDIFENIEGCCTFNQSKITAAHAIQRIVRSVVSSNTIIFTDFKAGYDDRYKIYTGVINDKIDDYDPLVIRRDIDNLRSAELLTCQQYHELIALVKSTPSIDDVVALNEKLRTYWVVRWKSDEILQGYIVRPGNYKLYLDVALTQGSIVKLDTIAKISSPIEDSRYVEVTNFFLITQKDKYGGRVVLSEELGDYAQSLLGDVYKYYNTNILKSIKRLWMYLAYQGRICDLGVFTELFSSDIALNSQLVGDLEVAIFLLSSKLPYDDKFLHDTINRKLTSLRGECADPSLYSHTKTDIEYMSAVKECLSKSIDTRTREWMHSRNINIMALVNHTS